MLGVFAHGHEKSAGSYQLRCSTSPSTRFASDISRKKENAHIRCCATSVHAQSPSLAGRARLLCAAGLTDYVDFGDGAGFSATALYVPLGKCGLLRWSLAMYLTLGGMQRQLATCYVQ